MEGGMGIRGNLLDPGAQEFYPTSQFALAQPQIYYPYPTPPSIYHLPHPQYVHPAQAADDGAATRAVVLSMVPRHVTEAIVRSEMAAFGGVRAVEMGALVSEGIVTVHFYDLRSAQAAVGEIREQHVRQQSRLGQQYGVVPRPWELAAGMVMMPHQMGGRGLVAGQAVWAQFAAKGLDVLNQGSLFVFTSDPAVSSDDIRVREIFQAFGPLKEVREIPSKPYHKFVEFFDVRDAARALSELNGKEILGRRLLIEFSRPGGQARSSSSSSSSSSSYHKRSSSHQNFPLPPRLLRHTSQPSSGRWNQGRGGGTSQSSSSSGGSGGTGERGEGIVLLKKNDASISNISRNGNANNSSSTGRRNKSSYPSSQASSSKQQQSNRKGWKNHPKKSGESRFLFKGGEMEESASSGRDSRTTVMIKNIPNKYSQKLLLNMLDNHCIHCNEQIGDGEEEPLSAYDFVYLPIDFNNNCNVGYGFVNLTSPEATVRLYRAFHMQPWEVFNSRKICQVTYARLQGLAALKDHFKNSKFACDNDEYMPAVFSPPRDGKQLTEPVPIGGRGAAPLTKIRAGGGEPSDLGGASSTTTSSHAPSDHADGGDDDHDDEEDVGVGDGGSDETGSGLSEALLHLSCNQD